MDVVVTIAEYKRLLKSLGYADKTVALYQWGLDVFIDYLKEKGITDIRKVSRQVVTDYRAHVMTGPLAAETKATKLRAVKRLFEHLIDENLLLINPSEGMAEICRRNRLPGEVLSKEEMKALMGQPNTSLRTGLRDRAVMEVLYSTGIRVGELLKLEVYDVDLKEGVLFIRKGKGRKQRVVPLSAPAAGYLKEYLEKIRPHHARSNHKERRVFLNSSGNPMTWNNVRTNLYTHSVRAGIGKRVSPHTFRRSCATHMIQNGADIRYVQQLLGHKSLKTTQLYTKVIPVEVKKTHERYHPNRSGHDVQSDKRSEARA